MAGNYAVISEDDTTCLARRLWEATGLWRGYFGISQEVFRSIGRSTVITSVTYANAIAQIGIFLCPISFVSAIQSTGRSGPVPLIESLFGGLQSKSRAQYHTEVTVI